MLHPNLNQNIDLRAEEAGTHEGFFLEDLARGAVVEIQTQHHHYRLIKRSDSHVRISGHPTFCPIPVEVVVEGSFGSGPQIPHPGFIGRGMHLIFKHPVFNLVTTSEIREIHKLNQTLSKATICL